MTVVDPSGSGAAADVAVSAEPGTALSAVTRELLAAVGRSAGELWCGAEALAAEAVLGVPPLLHGAVLTVDRPGNREPQALLELHVLAGPDCGAVHPVPPGELSIGRAAGARVRVADPDVSRLHAVLRVGVDAAGTTTLHDLGSTNGTTAAGRAVGRTGLTVTPGQVIRLGDTRLSLVAPETVPVSCRPDGEGHLLLNRPPRHPVPTRSVRVTMPSERRPADHQRFPLVALAVPLVLGAALAAVTRSPTYLLFLLLSPLMVLGTFLNDRVGGRRSRRTELAERAAAQASCDEEVRRAVSEQGAARRLAHPDPSTLLQSALGPRPRLWERRRGDDDFLEVRVGLGTVASTVEVHRPATADRAETTEHPDLDDVPVTVSLSRAGVVGLAGPREQVLPLARSVTAQLAGWHSPHHLGVVLLTADPGPDAAEAWDWLRWLPHARPVHGESPRALVGVTPDQVRARVDELVTLLDARSAEAASRPAASPWPGRAVVVVLDGAGALRRTPGVARLLAEGPQVGIHPLCCDIDLVSLPVECRATVEVQGSRLHVRSQDAMTYAGVVPDGVDDRWSHRLSRALALLRDATPDGRHEGLPGQARLLDLLPADATDAASLEASWRVEPHSTRVPLGVGADGEPYVVDLATDGPHVLVAGTTGSGKSELLQSLVAGLAVANRPDRMCFVLIDYKGGAAFRGCAGLPHTVGMVTDLDGHLTERALQSLGAELRRREQVLRTAGCADLDSYLADHADPAGAPRDRSELARLVLVVDEFATLVDELPDFVGGLVGIAQRGRSLGVHLVLATQRPTGVVSADIRANTGLRIALRVTDPAESRDVVDVRDAADISRSTPGRAVARTGTTGVRLVQTAQVTGRAVVHDARPTCRRVPWEVVGDPRPAAGRATAAGPSDLTRIVAASTEAARRIGASPPPSPWLPPLPGLVTTADLAADVEQPPGDVSIALRDVPREQRREHVTFRLPHGDHLLVAGGARSGRSTLLRTLAVSLAARFDVRDVHLYALDAGGGALSALARLPNCGAIVTRDESDRGDRLLTRLVEEVERRQQVLAHNGLATLEDQRAGARADDRLPWIVLLVDGWESLQLAYEDVEHGRPLERVGRIVREGGAVGVRVVLTGDRTVLTSRVGAAFRTRLVLPLPDPTDYGLAGIPVRQVPAARPPGRALLGDGTEAQVALLPGDSSGAGQVAAVERIAAETSARHARAPTAGRLVPIRVAALPGHVDVEDVSVEAKALPTGAGWALLGVGGDDLRPVGVDLVADGPAFVVAGPPGSGRSTTLATVARWLGHQGRPTVVVSHRRSPLRSLAGEPGVLACLGPADAQQLQDLLRDQPHLTVLADDAETLHDTPVERPLIGLLHPDADGDAALALAGATAGMAACFRGLTVEARRGRTGLLLGQVAPGDGDLFGLRLARQAGGPPGRGLLVVRGQVTPVQVARTAFAAG